MNRPTEKRCPGCGKTKALATFSKNKARRDGVQVYCKFCALERVCLSMWKRVQRGMDAK